MERWQQFWRLMKPYWGSAEKLGAIALLVLLLVFSMGSSICLILEVLQRGELISALAARNGDRFTQALVGFGVIIVLNIPALSLKQYWRDQLGLHWRRWLTDQFRHAYLTHHAFYRISMMEEIDNPDQRIAEDIRNFTQQSLNLLVIFCDSLVQLLGFGALLWIVSKSLLIVLLIYAALGTLLTSLVFGKVLIRLNGEQLKREANFRFGLLRVRENAEAIAFYRGEPEELNTLQQRFSWVYQNFNRLLRWQFNLTMFQNGYQYLTFILPFIVLAPRLFAGELEIGAISQSQAAFERIGLALGLIITQFAQISAFMAGIARLDQLAAAAEISTHATVSQKLHSTRLIQRLTQPIANAPLQIENVTVYIPRTETILIENLTLAIAPQQSLLVMGESGVGKSALLRAIAGLWQEGLGTIWRPSSTDLVNSDLVNPADAFVQNLYFLPQKPYLVLGSLRQQLLYPKLLYPTLVRQGETVDTCRADQSLHQMLDQVNLSYLLDRWGGLDADPDWSKVLSLGEQQRLAMARLLLAKPQYALLDEATSALDEASEAYLYGLLDATAIAYISVGHRPTLTTYHQQVLQLRRDRSWSLNAV
jgi:ABC-type uncharacterized transport system fused permease/ATPase subunit